MRAKRALLLVLALCIVTIPAGCWDAKDINDKALVTLILTDRQNDEFIFYAEIPNLAVGQNQGVSSNKEQYQIVTGVGTSYADARQHLNAKMDKHAFLGSIRALVITNELAKKGIEEYMYRIQNMPDFRKTLNIVTTSENPEDFLSVKPENNISIGYSIDDTVQTINNDGSAVVYTASDMLEFLYAGYSFVLINMDLREGQLAYDGYTIIHNGKYLDFIPLEDSNGLTWLLGDNIKLLYVVPFEQDLATVEVITKCRTITPSYEDGHLTWNIRFNFESTIEYLESSLVLDERLQAQIKQNLQVQLLNDLSDAIRRSISYPCDYLGFMERFRVAYPNDAKQIDWLAAYLDATFNISVESTIEVGGMMDLKAQGRNEE